MAPVNEPHARLLVVEDEPVIRELLAGSLRFAGFEVLTAETGPGAVKLAQTAPDLDLILLDIMLPGMDGFDVLRTLRASHQVPVIFLTARTSLTDRVDGLTLGGDDYIVKPFSLAEVLARIEAVLRRSRGEPPARPRLKVADLELDEETHEVRRAGTVVSLSPIEFKLLRFFILNSGRVLTRATLLDHVWQYQFKGESNLVELYVSYLRRKIDSGEPKLLHTVRGVGYVLRVPPP